MARRRTPRAEAGPLLRIQLRIHGALGIALGPGRAELLEHIDETGSIREAAQRMEMSYNRAWQLVHGTNEAFARPLVTATRGGDRRGGAALTDEGRKLLALYRSMEAAAARAAIPAKITAGGSSVPHRLAALFVAALALLAAAPPARAAETHVAVAANFTGAAREIAKGFAAATGHTAVLSFGSTGQLYTQIAQDAPFQVFLAADAERPKKAVDEGLALADSRFTYALGRIVLYSRDATRVQGETTLRESEFRKLAIANPVTAPYGAAAVEAMKKLGVHDALAPKLVQGTDIAQAFQFVATGNAELGFVALSQVAGRTSGSRWIVPPELYTPIRQDAVLLRNGETSEAARAFLEYLKGSEARGVLARFGYAPAE